MFDVEYGEYLGEGTAREIRAVAVSRPVLLQLAEAAFRAAATEVSKWHEAKEAEIVTALMHDKSSGLLRFLSRIFGQTIPDDADHARRMAKEQINRYPTFMRCWRADDALATATRWLGAAKKLTYINSFDVPVSDFDELRDWASKS